ncbi:MAG TPA: MFS transporter [Marmoricola sp.]|nr:MFS transporter [Marmoricola sp.]
MTIQTTPALITRPLLLRFVSVIASSIGFYLPLAAMPVFAGSSGAPSAAGAANGALLVATVAGELVTPRIVRHLGYRWALAGGLFLLGVPALLLIVSSGLETIVAVSALRGLGFAVSVVAGGALTASLIPAQRRGEGLALVGLVGGVPSLLALPLGAWAAQQGHFVTVFVATAAAPALALLTLPGLPGRDVAPKETHGVGAGLRKGAFMRPATVFGAAAAAAGIVVTYLPLAVSGRAAWVTPAALFLQPTAATLGRWFAGRVGDRRGQLPLLVPSTALAVVGMAAMAWTSSSVSVVAGAAVFGIGFGILQNATLSLMYSRAADAEYSTVSAIWNASYDLGMAVGAVGVGVLTASTGYPAAFALTAVAMVPALLLAQREGTPRRTVGIHAVEVAA